MNSLHPTNIQSTSSSHHHNTRSHHSRSLHHNNNNSSSPNPHSEKFIHPEQSTHVWHLFGFALGSFAISTILCITLAVVIALGVSSSKSPKSCYLWTSTDDIQQSSPIRDLLEDVSMKENDSFVLTRDMFSRGEFAISRFNNMTSEELIREQFNLNGKGWSVGTLQLRTWSLPATMDLIWNDGKGVSNAVGGFFALTDTITIGKYASNCMPLTGDSVVMQNQSIYGATINQQVKDNVRSFFIIDGKGQVRAVMQQRVDFISYELPIVRYDNSTSVIAMLRKNYLNPNEQWILTIKNPLLESEMTDGFGYNTFFYLIGYITFREK
ncbi:hypothetical protein FDP41_006410 [Naegleria fowleri]|uniref:Uncharacterized protein n=1 Tax=Naegleria fowleri TaxID=5763 RepID=A0A6A5BJT5_NAEFO|nr:uncharacterized protein FDP41_006410 [Naegleria fowleri]KAF0974378.1 hypothetical protein FDP41_006410 [Naegleria fowleri]CAG4712985.1 unnamed protein product [Naegleria fowleri]